MNKLCHAETLQKKVLPYITRRVDESENCNVTVVKTALSQIKAAIHGRRRFWFLCQGQRGEVDWHASPLSKKHLIE